MFKKRKSIYKRTKVIFINENVKFETEFFGDPNYLADELHFESSVYSQKSRMNAYKKKEVVDFSYLKKSSWDFGVFRTVTYTFDREAINTDLEKFKALVNPYFIVENMYVTEKKRSKKS